MDREIVNPPGVFPPQAHYSHVARVDKTLYIAGQVGLDTGGQLIGLGDAEAQADQVWRNLSAILANFGGTLQHIVKTTTFITNWGYRPDVARARDRNLSAPYPPNTFVVISSLADPRYLVEIEAIAVLD